jgi:hypothetical protein
MLRITPKPGLVIRDPEHQDRRILPEEGILVSRLNPFWLRRLNDGDIDVLAIPDQPPLRTVARRDPEV